MNEDMWTVRTPSCWAALNSWNISWSLIGTELINAQFRSYRGATLKWAVRLDFSRVIRNQFSMLTVAFLRSYQFMTLKNTKITLGLANAKVTKTKRGTYFEPSKQISVAFARKSMTAKRSSNNVVSSRRVIYTCESKFKQLTGRWSFYFDFFREMTTNTTFIS